MWLLELALVAAAGGPRAVVTFDNGGFNAPLYAPRQQGHARPSVAKELAAAMSRVMGENPEVWTYLPPGRTEGRPGDPYRVWPRRAGCAGAAESSDDPCWCGAGDRCWEELDVNRHPGGSTSLYLTAARVREAPGPRIEVHFTDLFEEDPSAAEDPADSDRCVTRDGVRRALEGLLAPGVGSVDHLAVGLLRARIAAPPAGRDVGSSFRFVEGADGCWSGGRTGAWTSGREPLDFAVAVVVVGVDTASRNAEVASFLDAMAAQLGTDEVSLDLIVLREPDRQATVEATVELGELLAWVLPVQPEAAAAPCDQVQSEVELTVDGLPVAATATASCDGKATISVSRTDAVRAWSQAHGLDPWADAGLLTGTVAIHPDPAALAGRLTALEASAAGVADRPLPMFGVLAEVTRGHVATPWRRQIAISARVAGLDQRPWALAAAAGSVAWLVGAPMLYLILLRLQANRAYRAAWERSAAEDADPLRQRPVAVVLAEARRQLSAAWLGRAAGAGVVALVGGVGIAWLVLQLHLVWHG